MELDGLQQEAMAGKAVAEEAVPGAIAVTGIADDGVTQVGHVAAQLVAPPGARFEFHEAATGCWVRTDGDGNFEALQRAVGGPGGFGAGLSGRPGILPEGLEGIIEAALAGNPAADQGMVVFFYGSAGEEGIEVLQGLRIEGEKEDATGRLIQAVAGVHLLSELVTEQLDAEAALPGIEPGPVDEEPGRFVDGDEDVVLMENLEHRFGHPAGEGKKSGQGRGGGNPLSCLQ
jgi:hypothetical protein